MTPRGLAAGLLTALLAAAAAVGHAAGERPETQVKDSPAAPICSAAASPPGNLPAFDPVTARAAVSAAAQRADPGALILACEYWRQLLAAQDQDSRVWLRWHADVAVALIWLRRLDESRSVAEWAYRQLQRIGANESQDLGYLAGLLALTWAQRGRVDESLHWSERGLEHQQHPLAKADPKTFLTARLNHANFLARARRQDEATAQFERVLADARGAQPPEDQIAAVALRGMGIIQQRRGNAEGALAFVREEIALRRDRLPDDTMQLGTALQNEAVQLIQLARFAEAQQSLEQAVELQARGGVDLWGNQAATLETLSGLQNDRGQTQAALASALRAVALIKENGSDQGRAPRLALALRRVAAAQLSAGDLPGALASAREALAIFDALPPATELSVEWVVREIHARVQLQLSAPLQVLQELDRAKGRAAGRSLSPQEQASMLMLTAGAHQQLGAVEQAKAALQQADVLLGDARLPADNPLRSSIAADLCVLDGTGCQELLGALQAASGWLPAAEVRVYLGMAKHGSPDLQSRLDWAAKATWAAHASGNPSLVWWSYAAYAQVLAEAGRDAEASFFAKKAITLVQQQRMGVGATLGTAAESAFMSDKEQPYRLAAQILARQGRIAESLAVLRLLRRQELDDFVERGATSAGLDGAALTRNEERLNSALNAVLQDQVGVAAQADALRRLVQTRRATREEAARLAELEAQLLRNRAESQRRWLALLASMQNAVALAEPASAGGLTRVPNRPREPGTLHAHFVSGPQSLTVIFVGYQSQTAQVLAVPQASLGPQIAQLLDELRQRRPGLAQARRLYEHLGRTLDEQARRLGAQRIILWLDGPLRYLPFGYLHDGSQHLAQRYLIARAVYSLADATASDVATQAAGEHRPRVEALGVTRALAGLPALRAVGSELCHIVDGPIQGLDEVADGCRPGSAVTGTGPFAGTGAANQHFTAGSLEAAAQRVASGGYLHIGTHFVLRPGNARESWMLMGDGGRLSVDGLSRLRLGRPALITLSACETATPAQGANGREVDGLASVMMQQGAASVLATLWQVDDQATARLMKHFYSALGRQPADALAALAAAQRRSIAEDRGAPDWAAYVLAVQVR